MGTRLYVGNLPFDTDESQLRALFQEGERNVTEVKIIMDRRRGERRDTHRRAAHDRRRTERRQPRGTSYALGYTTVRFGRSSGTGAAPIALQL